MLGNHIVLNDSLFNNVFGSDFSGDILHAWQYVVRKTLKSL